MNSFLEKIKSNIPIWNVSELEVGDNILNAIELIGRERFNQASILNLHFIKNRHSSRPIPAATAYKILINIFSGLVLRRCSVERKHICDFINAFFNEFDRITGFQMISQSITSFNNYTFKVSFESDHVILCVVSKGVRISNRLDGNVPFYPFKFSFKRLRICFVIVVIYSLHLSIVENDKNDLDPNSLNFLQGILFFSNIDLKKMIHSLIEQMEESSDYFDRFFSLLKKIALVIEKFFKIKYPNDYREYICFFYKTLYILRPCILNVNNQFEYYNYVYSSALRHIPGVTLLKIFLKIVSSLNIFDDPCRLIMSLFESVNEHMQHCLSPECVDVLFWKLRGLDGFRINEKIRKKNRQYEKKVLKIIQMIHERTTHVVKARQEFSDYYFNSKLDKELYLIGRKNESFDNKTLDSLLSLSTRLLIPDNFIEARRTIIPKIPEYFKIELRIKNATAYQSLRIFFLKKFHFIIIGQKIKRSETPKIRWTYLHNDYLYNDGKGCSSTPINFGNGKNTKTIVGTICNDMMYIFYKRNFKCSKCEMSELLVTSLDLEKYLLLLERHESQQLFYTSQIHIKTAVVKSFYPDSCFALDIKEKGVLFFFDLYREFEFFSFKDDKRKIVQKTFIEEGEHFSFPLNKNSRVVCKENLEEGVLIEFLHSINLSTVLCHFDPESCLISIESFLEWQSGNFVIFHCERSYRMRLINFVKSSREEK